MRYRDPAIFPAALAMGRTYEFNLTSPLRLIHKDIRSSQFVKVLRPSVDAGWFTSLGFEVLNVTSHLLRPPPRAVRAK